MRFLYLSSTMKFIGSAALCWGFMTASAQAAALYTAPDTDVVNTVTVDYKVGNVDQDQVSADVTFEVDRKIDVQVTNQGDLTGVAPASTDRVLVYQVTNEGNDSQAFDIDVTTTAALTDGLTLDATGSGNEGTFSIYISTDATFDGGDTVYDPAGFTTAATPTAADDTDSDDFYVIIVSHIPSTAQDAEEQTFTITATAIDGGSPVTETATTALNTVDTVFGDAAGSLDSALDGTHSDQAKYVIASADLSSTKDVAIVDDNRDGSYVCSAASAVSTLAQDEMFAIPGACLEYTITVTNNGATADATDIDINDDLPTGVTFVDFTETTGWDASPSHSAGTITASIATLPATETRTLKFRVTVD